MPKAPSNASPHDPHERLRQAARLFLAMLGVCAVSSLVALMLSSLLDVRPDRLTAVGKVATTAFQLPGTSLGVAYLCGLGLGYTFWAVRGHLEGWRTHIYVGSFCLVGGHVAGALAIFDAVHQVSSRGAAGGGKMFFILGGACPILLVIGFMYLLVGACYFAQRRHANAGRTPNST